MDLDETQALDEYEYNEAEEQQEVKKDRKQVGQLKVFRTKDFEEKIYDIFEGENFIGRDESCDVYLPRKSLSKTHACIEVSEELHLIYDHNSKNRTRRDKTILKPQVRYELHHGDMMTLADTKCQYFKGKIEQYNDDDETGSETGSESMLPEGSAVPVGKDAVKDKDAYAADTDSETDDEKNPVITNKPIVYSSDEKIDKPDVAEDSEPPKPIVPAFMYDSSDEDDDDDERVSKHKETKSSSDIKAQMDVSADSGTLAFGLVSPDDMPIIRPTSKKMPEVENTPLTLVYSPDTQDHTPDNPSILPKGREEGSSCAATLIYGSESPYQEKSPVKQKGSNQPDAAELSDDDLDTSRKFQGQNVSEKQREIASCPETLPVQEIESLKETPMRDGEPSGTYKLEETPLNDMPKVGETPSELNVYLPETQGFSPGNEDTSICEPTQAYLQESPVDTPKDTPGEMVSDVTSIPDSEEEGEQSQSDADVKKVLSYDDDSATQAYTWNDSDATDDEDDELRFQATQAYPLQQPEKNKETKPGNVSAKEDGEEEQGADRIPSASSPPRPDMQQTIAYEVAEMATQAYDTGEDDHAKDQRVEPTVPYNMMDMETQAYEVETDESTSESNTGKELDNPSAAAVGDRKGVTVEPTLPYDLESETPDFDDEKGASKKNADGNPVIEATVPYDIEMGTQAYTGKDMEDSETDDEGSLEKKEGKMADMMETQAYGADLEAEEKEESETDDEGNLEKKEGNMADMMETQAYGADLKAEEKEESETDDEGNLEKKEGNMADIMETQAYGVDGETEDADKAGPSNVNDDYGETQAYGLEDQVTSPATDDIIPDSDEALSQEIPRNRIDDTVNNNVPDKTSTTQQVEENRQEGEEEVAIVVRPKRRGKGRVTQSSTEENQQPPMPDKPEDTTLKEPSAEVTRKVGKSPNKPETAPEDAGLKRSARGKKSTRITEVKAKARETSVNDSEEDEFQPAKGTRERRSTRGKTLKKNKEDDVEEEPTLSSTKKKTTRGRQTKKSEEEMKVPEDVEEEQKSAATTEKKARRGRRSKKTEAESIVQEDAAEEEQQQETAASTEKKARRGRHPRKTEAESRVQEDAAEEEQQEVAALTEKKATRGRGSKKSIAQTKEPEDAEEQETPSVTEKTTRGRRSKKSEVETKELEDTVDEQQEKPSVFEKSSARGRRSKKSGVEPASIENVLPDDTDEDLHVPVKKPLRGRRSAKKDKEIEKEEKTPQNEETEEAVPVQDPPVSDEELPSLELILSAKKATKGKGRTKGKTKEPETPELLPSKEEMSSETIEVKPFFPRRGRGRVTQSDESASAIPVTQLSEFKEEDLMSPHSVAKSISARKGGKGKKENEGMEHAEMDTSASQSSTSSSIESKTRKRGKEEMAVATDLDESQTSVASSVGRKPRGKGRGKHAKAATDADDDTQAQSASQASDVSESHSSVASSVESRARGKGRRKTARSGTLDDTQEQEVQETPSKKGRRIKEEVVSPTVHSPSLRERKAHTPPRIMFTGVSDKQAEKIVTNLGGTLVDSVYECSHLITDKVRRTVKFLCGVASGQMIVQPQWLTACKKAKHFIEPVPFIVSDKAAEKQYSFSLQQSLEKAQTGGLLEGYKIHITKSVKPEPSQMKDIIKSAKGEYLPRIPRINEDNVLVISCEEDQDLCKPALACGLPVYSSELLLTGILRQELELDQNRLFSSEEEGNRKRKESGDSETPVKSASRKRRKK